MKYLLNLLIIFALLGSQASAAGFNNQQGDTTLHFHNCKKLRKYIRHNRRLFREKPFMVKTTGEYDRYIQAKRLHHHFCKPWRWLK